MTEKKSAAAEERDYNGGVEGIKGELKALAQDRKKWRRLSWDFSSAAELL